MAIGDLIGIPSTLTSTISESFVLGIGDNTPDNSKLPQKRRKQDTLIWEPKVTLNGVTVKPTTILKVWWVIKSRNDNRQFYGDIIIRPGGTPPDIATIDYDFHNPGPPGAEASIIITAFAQVEFVQKSLQTFA